VDLFDELLDWSQGVITSVEPDAIPKNALVRADNAQFASVGGNLAQMRKRLGMTLLNSTPFANTSATAGPAFRRGTVYTHRNAGVPTAYLATAQADGTLALTVDDGSTTTHTPTASFAALTNNLESASFVEMNNRLFALDSEGAKTSLLGTAEVGWGIAPTTIPTAAAGAAGNMTGAYDVLVTVYDSRIGEESDRSLIKSVTGLSSEKLDLTITAAAAGDTHLYARVYLRKPALGSAFLRVNAGTGYDSAHFGFPLADAGATIAVTLDITDATLTEVLIATPPAVSARGLPPTDAKYAAVYARRMFLLSDGNLYWSELDRPDAFNPLNVEPIKPPNGGVAIGLTVDDRSLHIWCETGRFTLTGDADTRTWVFELASPTIGMVGPHAAAAYRGSVFFWNREHGPMELLADGTYRYIGTERIRPDVQRSLFSSTFLARTQVAADDGRVVFALAEPGQAALTRLYSYHAEMGAWETTRWNPMRVGALFTGVTSADRTHLYVGNPNGQLFRLLDSSNDGVRAGTVQGTFVAAGAAVSVISDTDASFDVTGAGLIERTLAVLDEDGQLVTQARIYITANSATALTLNTAVTGLTTGATYTYAVGGPAFWLETRWGSMELPFVRKRFDDLYVQFRADSGLAQINLTTAFSWDVLRRVAGAAADVTNDLWDSAYWDVSAWNALDIISKRIRLLKNGLNYRVRLQNVYPNQSFTVLKLSVLARRLHGRNTHVA